jgi:carlactone synthase/all-trans-10'-apo-beta-carotenal 13,14-cleaving dioxygenase
LQPAGRSHPKPPGPPRSRNLPLLPQASFPDKVKGDLTTAHPTIMGDGTMLNFTRSLPFGGFHIFKQASADPPPARRFHI